MLLPCILVPVTYVDVCDVIHNYPMQCVWWSVMYTHACTHSSSGIYSTHWYLSECIASTVYTYTYVCIQFHFNCLHMYVYTYVCNTPLCYKLLSLSEQSHCTGCTYACICVRWNLSIKDTLAKGHLSNEDTVCCPNYIELYTKLPLN